MSFSRICKMLQVGGAFLVAFALISWHGHPGLSKYFGFAFAGAAALALGTIGRVMVRLFRRADPPLPAGKISD
jgi:hypothetical protein